MMTILATAMRQMIAEGTFRAELAIYAFMDPPVVVLLLARLGETGSCRAGQRRSVTRYSLLLPSLLLVLELP